MTSNYKNCIITNCIDEHLIMSYNNNTAIEFVEIGHSKTDHMGTSECNSQYTNAS